MHFRKMFFTEREVGHLDNLCTEVVTVPAFKSSRIVWTTLSDICFLFGWSFVETGF